MKNGKTSNQGTFTAPLNVLQMFFWGGNNVKFNTLKSIKMVY